MSIPEEISKREGDLQKPKILPNLGENLINGYLSREVFQSIIMFLKIFTLNFISSLKRKLDFNGKN